MAEMKVERTADGREIVYHVCIHPEVFEWLSVPELTKKLTEQFTGHLDEVLYPIRDGEEVK